MMGVAGLGESLFNAGLEEALLRPRFVRGSVASRLAVLHAFGSAGPRHPCRVPTWWSRRASGHSSSPWRRGRAVERWAIHVAPRA